ncbi:MAG TPA: 4-hydroxythreonine-4-phosphate dehydrogenase PdxA, partial [Reyranella sp.]
MAGLAPIAISMGEPAGIGPDLILQLYAARAEHELPPFIVTGNMAFLAARARRLGLNINFTATTAGEANGQFPVALPVLHIEGLVPDKPGETSHLSGKVVMESIARAVSETLNGACRAVVTGPIHKAALYNA